MLPGGGCQPLLQIYATGNIGRQRGNVELCGLLADFEF
jgi:hypothetical protein